MPHSKCSSRMCHAPKVMGTKCMFLSEDEVAHTACQGGCLLCSLLFPALSLPWAGGEGFGVLPPCSSPASCSPCSFVTGSLASQHCSRLQEGCEESMEAESPPEAGSEHLHEPQEGALETSHLVQVSKEDP